MGRDERFAMEIDVRADINNEFIKDKLWQRILYLSKDKESSAFSRTNFILFLRARNILNPLSVEDGKLSILACEFVARMAVVLALEKYLINYLRANIGMGNNFIVESNRIITNIGPLNNLNLSSKSIAILNSLILKETQSNKKRGKAIWAQGLEERKVGEWIEIVQELSNIFQEQVGSDTNVKIFRGYCNSTIRSCKVNCAIAVGVIVFTGISVSAGILITVLTAPVSSVVLLLITALGVATSLGTILSTVYLLAQSYTEIKDMKCAKRLVTTLANGVEQVLPSYSQSNAEAARNASETLNTENFAEEDSETSSFCASRLSSDFDASCIGEAISLTSLSRERSAGQESAVGNDERSRKSDYLEITI